MKIINNAYKILLISIIVTTIYGCNSGGSAVVNPTNLEAKKASFLKRSYFGKPYGITVDSAGNIYMAMADKNIIQKISVTDGSILTVAGNGFAGKPASGHLAINEPLSLIGTKPTSTEHVGMQDKYSVGQTSFYGSVAVDSAGNIYIADTNNNQIEKVDYATGISTVVAGSGNNNPTNGIQATSVELSDPTGIAIDTNNNLYIADSGNALLEKVNLNTDTLNIIAGGGNNNPSITPQAGNNVSIMPYGVTTDSENNVYITDQMNNFVEKIEVSSNMLSVIAGNGNNKFPLSGLATNSPLGSSIDGVSVDSQDNVYVADASNNVIEEISKGNLSVIVGNGQNGYPYFGIPTKSSLSKPHGVTIDEAGNIYIADTNNHIIEKYLPSNNHFSINYGDGFVRLVGPFQCVNDAVTGNKCGCLYDLKSGNTWYAAIKSGYFTNWETGGSSIAKFNAKGHCGLNSWHIPSITTLPWSGSPYSMNAITIGTQNPGGAISTLAKAALSEDNNYTFHLLNNGFYLDLSPNQLPAEDIYWLNNSTGIYSYNNQEFVWGLLNLDSNGLKTMYAEPQMILRNGNMISEKVLLVSD